MTFKIMCRTAGGHSVFMARTTSYEHGEAIADMFRRKCPENIYIVVSEGDVP